MMNINLYPGPDAMKKAREKPYLNMGISYFPREMSEIRAGILSILTCVGVCFFVAISWAIRWIRDRETENVT